MPEHQSDIFVIFTVTMKILLEPTSNKLLLDEKWFDLTKDTLRDALQITPVNNNQAFISPPSDLPEADMKEILHVRMWKTESYKSHEDHMQLFEALEKSMNHDHSEELAQDLAEARKKKKKSHESPKTPPGSPSHQPPPPPPLPAGPSGASGAPGASGSS
nr:hypothetical protein [Tanacetum cinerariifolium]